MVAWQDLSKLPLSERVQSLYRHGKFVMNIRYYQYKINLYLLGNDYIEVFVNHKRGAIESIELLDRNHSRMKFYSDQVKLTGLLNSNLAE